jgi:hypothetical protein
MWRLSAGRSDTRHLAHLARVALAVVVALGGVRVAFAQTEPTAPALTWHAPAGCPSEARVVAEVGQNLAGSGALFASFAAVVGVRRPAGGRWQASLLFQAHDTRAERRFEAESCEAIVSAVALVIALWVEGGADTPSPDALPLLATAPAPFVPPPPEVVRAPMIAASRPTRPAPPAVDPARARYALTVNWLLDRNTMPESPAPGIEATLGRIWTVQHWRLRALAGLSYFPSEKTPFNGVTQGDLQLVDVSSRGCLTFAAARLEIGPCAGAELAVMHGSGMYFQESTQSWLALLGGAVVSWEVYPAVALFARGEVVRPTVLKTFNVPEDRGVTVAYVVPALAGRGALGIEWRFR